MGMFFFEKLRQEQLDEWSRRCGSCRAYTCVWSSKEAAVLNTRVLSIDYERTYTLLRSSPCDNTRRAHNSSYWEAPRNKPFQNHTHVPTHKKSHK